MLQPIGPFYTITSIW